MKGRASAACLFFVKYVLSLHYYSYRYLRTSRRLAHYKPWSLYSRYSVVFEMAPLTALLSPQMRAKEIIEERRDPSEADAND